MTPQRPSRDPHPHEEQLVGFLLNELPAAAMDAVDRHVASCRSCQETLARLDGAFVAVVEALPEERTPEDGWDRIEERLRAWRPGASDDRLEDSGDDHDGRHDEHHGRSRGEAQDDDRGDDRVPARTPPPRRGASAAAWIGGLAASLVLAAVLGSWGAWQRQQLLHARTELRSLEGRVAALESLIGTVQARADELVTDQRRLAGWLSRGDVTSARLPEAGDGVAPGSVLFLPDGRALVVMRDVPAAGRTYQVWGARGAELVPLTTFVERTVEVEADAYESVVISVEPAGGSDTPTEVLGAAAPG